MPESVTQPDNSLPGPLAAERTRIHRDSLESTLTWVWLAMIVIFSGQWVWIALAEDAGTGIELITFGFIGVQFVTIVAVFLKPSRAQSMVLTQLFS